MCLTILKSSKEGNTFYKLVAVAGKWDPLQVNQDFITFVHILNNNINKLEK